MVKKTNSSRQKIYVILFTLLVLFTFVTINNQNSISGEVVGRLTNEEWLASCVGATPLELAEDFTDETECKVPCLAAAQGRPFTLGQIRATLTFESCADEQISTFIQACNIIC